MKWLTVTWSMTAAACLTLMLVHLVIWFQSRRSHAKWAHLLFSIAALAVVAVAYSEIVIFRATSTHSFGNAMRWAHLPIWLMIVSIVWFVYVYFGTANLKLAWAVTVIRTIILIVNFLVTPNVNYVRIDAIEQLPILGDETITIGNGPIRGWTRLAQVGSILFLIYVIGATVRLWRTGDSVGRRRAVGVGGSLILFVLLASVHSALVQQSVVKAPYLISVPFLIPLGVMAYQLGTDVVRAARLSSDLDASQWKLREAAERVELAAGAADLGFWEWDVGRNTFWANLRCRQMFLCDADEKLDLERLLHCVHPDDHDLITAQLQRTLNTGRDFEAQYRTLDAHGEIRWLTARGSLDTNDSRDHVIIRGVVIDLTERRQAELEVAKHRNDLAHLSRVSTLGELSGSLAHELNQPLTAILSNAQAAQRFMASDKPDLDEVRGILSDIVSEDKRAGDIIRRLRSLFKKGEVEKEPLEVNQLIHNVLALLHSDLVNHGVAVSTELRAGLPPIHGDRVHLQQVLINLLLNACDAMKDTRSTDRQIVVRSDRDSDGGISVAVSDQGCGIPPNRIAEIFEPFVTTKGEGMGLGLAVCRSIMQAHGGTVRAVNNASNGNGNGSAHAGATLQLVFPAMAREHEPVGGAV